jgi:2-keto-4-pentenoate hydratase/2-oxohepta-3-ene-1,7-dioic acid hydratase in catechol pathway
MRLVSYESETGSRVAVAHAEGFVDLNHAEPTLPSSMRQLLSLGAAGLRAAARAAELGKPLPASELRLLAPVPDPAKILCVGLNYADHARETGAELPSEPVIFNKFPTALRGPGDSIVLPKISQKVDFEAELVVVIGRGGRHIRKQDAMEHVAGYTCGHDVSARDWQIGKPGGQWLLGKSFDSFAPIGPELVTADEVSDPHQLDISLTLNGQTMQSSNTRQLIFSIDHVIAYLSEVFTLEPGDLLFTGTPPGVGAARKPPVFLRAGDQVVVEIENIGRLHNSVVDPQ